MTIAIHLKRDIIANKLKGERTGLGRRHRYMNTRHVNVLVDREGIGNRRKLSKLNRRSRSNRSRSSIVEDTRNMSWKDNRAIIGIPNRNIE